MKPTYFNIICLKYKALYQLTISEDLIDKAKVLDGLYIPTRYANGHRKDAPFEHYGKIQSRDAIEYAREILEFVRFQMA